MSQANALRSLVSKLALHRFEWEKRVSLVIRKGVKMGDPGATLEFVNFQHSDRKA